MERERPDRQRARDAATVLPFAAAILLMPPLIGIFAAPVILGGLPLIVLYVFAVWAAIIVGAFVLARRLTSSASHISSEEPPAGGGAP